MIELYSLILYDSSFIMGISEHIISKYWYTTTNELHDEHAKRNSIAEKEREIFRTEAKVGLGDMRICHHSRVVSDSRVVFLKLEQDVSVSHPERSIWLYNDIKQIRTILRISKIAFR